MKNDLNNQSIINASNYTNNSLYIQEFNNETKFKEFFQNTTDIYFFRIVD